MGVLECQTCVATTKMFLKSCGDIHENDVRTGKNNVRNIWNWSANVNKKILEYRRYAVTIFAALGKTI